MCVYICVFVYVCVCVYAHVCTQGAYLDEIKLLPTGITSLILNLLGKKEKINSNVLNY